MNQEKSCCSEGSTLQQNIVVEQPEQNQHVEERETGPSQVGSAVVTRPRLDIRESDHDYLVLVDMPGVNERSVEVLVEKRVLTLRGTSQIQVPAGYQQVHRESGPRYYERLIRLPEEVDATALTAVVKNGVLTVTIPKLQSAQTFRVSVQAG